MRLMTAVPFRFWEERVMRTAASENVKVWGYVLAVQGLEKWVFKLLTQPTEITVSLFIFYKQWHTYRDACSCHLISGNFGQ